MKIRVLSDLHIDVNDRSPLRLKDNDTFTIIAGDTAASPELATEWIRQNIQKGLVISGNHIVYAAGKRPIQDLKQHLATSFPPDAPITYLDHMTGTMHKTVENILFIGTTLYTNYALLPDVPVENAMWYAYSPRFGLNDFRLGYTRDNGKVRHIFPTDYRRWFIESQKEIRRIIEAHPDKEIVLITHHCPSEKCCATKGILLNTSYASDMESFIREHSNIKLWITGHVHERQNFKIGQCTVLMNPRGYEDRGEAFGFNPNTFVETRDWSIFQAPLKMTEQSRKVPDSFLRLACLEL